MTDERPSDGGAAIGTPIALDTFALRFDYSPSCVFIVGPDGNVCYANPAFCIATGASVEQLTGVCIEELGRARGGPIWQAIESARPWHGELSLQLGDRVYAGSLSLTPIADAAGTCVAVLCISDVLSERSIQAAASPALERTGNRLLVADPDGTILFIDRTVPGLAQADALGTSIYQYMPAEHHDRIRAYVAQVIQTKASVSYEIPAVGPYGTVQVYRTHLGPVVRDGEVVALSFMSNEMPEAPEIADRYRVLAGAGMEGLVIHADGIILDANEAACAMFGHDPGELIGRSIAQLFDQRTPAVVRQDSFYQTGTLHTATGLRSDGTTFALEICGKILPHLSGLSTVIALRNVSTRRRASRARTPTRQRASAPNAPKEDRGPIELSGRELDVLELLAQGMTNRQVAERINVSARTVDHHVSHILGKLGVSNRTAAAMAARRKGILR